MVNRQNMVVVNRQKTRANRQKNEANRQKSLTIYYFDDIFLTIYYFDDLLF